MSDKQCTICVTRQSGLYRRDTVFLLKTMLESEYVHRGRTLNAGVEGHPDEIFEGSRGASREA